jgi:hypothetical protein
MQFKQGREDCCMSPVVYRIKDWETLYETAETRKLENLRWVPLPNKHDGLGFRRLALQKNRSELLASWVLMLQVASKAKRGHRGALMRDGRGLDHEDLALMTGFSAQAFEQALIFFSDARQGWLVLEGVVNQPPPAPPAESPATPADSPATTGESPAEGKGMEGSELNGIDVGKKAAGAAPTSDADWLESLKSDPAYIGIDVATEHAKAIRWCETNRKQLSRRRFINWLNRAERPMGNAKPQSEFANAW